MANEDNEKKELGTVVGIYRVSSDGTVDALESVPADTDEEVSMFFTAEGIILVIGQVAATTGHPRPDRPAETWEQPLDKLRRGSS